MATASDASRSPARSSGSCSPASGRRWPRRPRWQRAADVPRSSSWAGAWSAGAFLRGSTLAAWVLVIVNLGVVAAGYATHSLRYAASGVSPAKFVLFFFVMALFDGPVGEEIGWRGVLLPELLRTMSPLAAAVGVVWYAWHVPLSTQPRGGSAARSSTSSFSTPARRCRSSSPWFFLKSRGSVFLMIYLHDATNFATFVRFKLFHRAGQFDRPDDRVRRGAAALRHRRRGPPACGTIGPRVSLAESCNRQLPRPTNSAGKEVCAPVAPGIRRGTRSAIDQEKTPGAGLHLPCGRCPRPRWTTGGGLARLHTKLRLG